MSNQSTKTEQNLRKLGQQVRKAWAKKHPMPEPQMDKIKDAIREQFTLENSRQPKPPEPDLEP